MINDESIILAITVSALATYFCRSLGVAFSSSLSEKSWLFDWIKCISIGIIVAVISKIIFFPEGILEDTTNIARIAATACLLISYYLIGKNILLSVCLSTVLFTFLNFNNL